MVVEATLCHIVGPKGVLLKKASRGFGLEPTILRDLLISVKPRFL